MNNLSKKLIALALCAALCLGAAGVVFAKTGNAAAAQPLAAQSVPVQTTPEVSLPQSTYKDETVYVLTGADGAVQQIIVSDWLKNPENALSVSDISDLTDIETVKGDALFTQSGTSLTWQTQAEDVYYQGNSEKRPAGVHAGFLHAGWRTHRAAGTDWQKRPRRHPLRLRKQTVCASRDQRKTGNRLRSVRHAYRSAS